MIFDLFRRRRNKKFEDEAISEVDEKWNKMWDLWADTGVESPYNELMTYQSEVNNGGHYQYFFNTENNGDVHREVDILCEILPENHKRNIQIAFKAYIEIEQDKNIEANEEILEKCDDEFFENEEEINDILKTFAERF